MSADMWQDLNGIETWLPWGELRARFADIIQSRFAAWVSAEQSHFREQLIFALGRFDEGVGILRYFEQHCVPPPGRSGRVRLLDIGAGNGGVSVAIANCRRYDVVSLDIVPNNDLYHSRKALELPVDMTVATGNKLPFASNSFDVILLLDMIEHVRHPEEMASEVMRVLAPGGACMLTTPPRLRYLLKPDPHFGIRGILFFPNAVQRFIVDHIFRRRVRGHLGQLERAYDVEHIFWHVREITKLFPGAEVDVLYNRFLHPGSPRFTRWWLEYETREFFWDRIMLRKPNA